MAVINLSNPIITPRIHAGSAPPLSGTSGTFAGGTGTGALYTDQTNNIVYVNEGTKASPYWTPVAFDQDGLLAYHSDFRSQLGKALADTAASAIIADGTGLRVFGQGIEVNGDSGLTVAVGEGGSVATLASTNEASHVAAIGAPAGVWQPDTHGRLLVIDAEFAVSTDLDTKSVFMGFVGTAADALDPAATGDTTTITLVQDDVAGVLFDASLTDATGLFLAHNKSNAAASIETDATGVDTDTDIEAAGTYQRIRVELQRTTTVVKMVVFKDKVQIGSIADALDEDEECSPVLYIESGTTSAEALLIRRFSAWALNPVA